MSDEVFFFLDIHSPFHYQVISKSFIYIQTLFTFAEMEVNNGNESDSMKKIEKQI